MLIMTGDRDMFQLVDDRVKILYTSGGPNPETKIYGVAEVSRRYGLDAAAVYRLQGAHRRHIPTTFPAYPASATRPPPSSCSNMARWTNLYAHLDEIAGPKTRQSLIDAARVGACSTSGLVTIHTDLDIAYDAEAVPPARLFQRCSGQMSLTRWNFAA